MKRLSARRPSPALVIACIALFISLGGVSYGLATNAIDSREIKNNTIRTQDIRNDEVRSQDIRNSTIRGRDVAQDTLTGDDINESKLGQVPSAALLGTLGPSGYAKAKQEAVHAAPLASGFTATPGSLKPGFWKDTLGIVHLEGSITHVAGGSAFTLPKGYLPAGQLLFQRDPASADVTIDTAGHVQLGSGAVALDGISFRAAP